MTFLAKLNKYNHTVVPALSKQNNIRFGNTTIDYQIRRSKRRKKTVQIILSGGGVRVLAPMTTSNSELQAIVRKRAPWILKHASLDLGRCP